MTYLGLFPVGFIGFTRAYAIHTYDTKSFVV